MQQGDARKGILHTGAGREPFTLTRYPPAPDLAQVVMRFWTVTWDLRGQQPHEQKLVPHPCVNLVIDPEGSGIFGVPTERAFHRLEGKGRVFGVKFRPGAFYPFLGTPVSALTGSAMSLRDVFGNDGDILKQSVLTCDDATDMIRVMERFLLERLPGTDDNVELINLVIDRIAADRTITKVDELLHIVDLGVSKRSLQRLFNDYVGVSPKWVIQKYRLMEVVDLLAAGNGRDADFDWAKLALDLGYFDQAHFIKDFKRIVGTPPASYAKQLAEG